MEGDGESVGELLGHTKPVHSVAFSPDSKYVVTASWDHTARVWDLATRKSVAELRGNREMLNTAFSPDSKRIVTASADGTAAVGI